MKKIKNGLSHRMRITLIEFGKLMPFLICAVVAISYFENINSLYFEDFVICADGIMLNKPLLWLNGITTKLATKMRLKAIYLTR